MMDIQLPKTSKVKIMLHSWIVTFCLLASISLASAQAPFKIEVEVAGMVYQAGKNISIPCDSVATVRVLSLSPDSGTNFCVSEVLTSILRSPSEPAVTGLIKVEDVFMEKGGCSFRFSFANPGTGSYTFRIYETINGNLMQVGGFARQRFLGVTCR